MKILIGSMSYRPNVSGVAIFIEQLTSFLAARGHQIILVVPARRLKTERVVVNAQLTIYYLRAYPNPTRRNFFIPFFVKRLTRQIVNEVRPDIVHVNDPMAMSRYLQRYAAELSIPTVVSNHFTLDYILAYFPRLLRTIAAPFLRHWIVRFYNKCQSVVCPTAVVKEYLVKIGITRPIVPLSNGVNLHRFYAYYPPDELRLAWNINDLPTVLYVGRLDKEKAVDLLIRAFAKVVADQPSQLLLVGEGDQRRKLERLTAKLRITRAVRFFGRVDHESDVLVGLYELAEICVNPCPIETQSISTLEAMAAGKPIVAANAGALPELVGSGENGILFEPGNVEALAEGLRILLRDSALRSRYGEQSLRKIARHELELSLGLYEKLYHQCLNSN